MSTALTSAESLVLRVVPYGEADLVVHLLVRGRGRLGAFARGARRSSKRFAGALEPFSVVSIEYSERRGADLVDLRGATLLEPWLALRSDLGRLAHAGYATELIRELAREREPDNGLYELLTAFFGQLVDRGPRSVALRALELAALKVEGLSPALDRCIRCGIDPGRGTSAFDAAAGGIVCGRCAGAWASPLGPGALELLRALQRGGIESVREAVDADLPLEPATRALRAFVERHVRHHLKSLSFLSDVGAPP